MPNNNANRDYKDDTDYFGEDYQRGDIMNTWLLLLNVIIHTSSGPIVYLDVIENSTKMDCELMSEYMKGELIRYGNGMQMSVTTTCTLKSQRVL